MTERRLPSTLALLAAAVMSAAGCDDDDDDDVAVVVTDITGVSAADFRTLSDYVSHPAVDLLFEFMPRHTGSSPPDVQGSYLAEGEVTDSSVPGADPGDDVETRFCLGPPADSAIEAAVVDASAVDAGALSFIEGSGDAFTVYTAFKSVQEGTGGGTCEIHEVVVFSGVQEADGSISSLSIGLAIVGLLGDCGGLSVDQIQVSSNLGELLGASCVGSGTPGDPDKVLLEVANFLVTDVDVFLDGAFAGTAPLLQSLFLEVDPGFTLSFESVPPENEGGDPLGEVLAGEFEEDTAPAGRFSQYGIGNQVGDDIYFAPIVWNRTGGAVTATVNAGTSLEAACGCSLASSPLAQHVLGYHFYDAPGIIAFDETNVLIDEEIPATDPPEFVFLGEDFIPGLDSGAVSLLIP